MNFDHEAYLRLLNEFINKGEQIRKFRDPAITMALTPMCRFLRIGRFTAQLSDLTGGAGRVIEPHIYFDSGNADEQRTMTADEFTSDRIKTRYLICQEKGGEDWIEDEKVQILSLAKQLFIFSERSYNIKLTEDIPMHDSEMDVYSLPVFLAAAGSAKKQGRITDFGAVYFNLKHFSAINENLGRKGADHAMYSFVHGLQERLRYEECICRIGGDNFVMLFEKRNLGFIKAYLNGTSVSYDNSGDTVNMTTSAGYYLISDDSDSPSDILDKASTAYQLAKNVYKRQYLFYDDEITKRQSHIREIEGIFPSAIANEEFKVFYQPKTQLCSNRLAGAEALCRWVRDGRVVPPGEFIPVLEGSRAICTLDYYMLDHVCSDIRRWLDEGKQVVKVSVNLSRLHLGDDDLLQTLIGIIDKHNVPHEYIEIELTETTTDVDYKELKKIVYGLREQGISTSVDDFGVGFSSLNLIREMPWNVLKIDKSFLPACLEDQDITKVKMLRHIITMSQDLGLECIVEGVETAEQVELLIDCKCFLAQGFYFDRPLPVNEFEKKLPFNQAS